MNLHQGPRTAPLQGPAASLRVAGGIRVLLLAMGMIVAAGALAGCGGGSAGATATRTPGPSVGKVTTDASGVQHVTLETEDDYLFTPDTFTVHPGEVRLTVRNVAKELTHNFRFSPDGGPSTIGAQIPLLAPGQSSTIDFTVQTPGSYRFECSFHTQLGQVGTMTVGG
jgi:plastocyanin